MNIFFRRICSYAGCKLDALQGLIAKGSRTKKLFLVTRPPREGGGFKGMTTTKKDLLRSKKKITKKIWPLSSRGAEEGLSGRANNKGFFLRLT